MPYGKRKFRSRGSRGRFRYRNRRYNRFRRSFKRGRFASKPTRKVFKGTSVPDEIFTKLNLVLQRDVEVAGGQNKTYLTIKGNSLYQPSGVSDYVLGVSQFAGFYTQCTVLASKISATLSIGSSELPANLSLIHGEQIMLPSLTSDPSTIPSFDEQKYHKWTPYSNPTSGRSICKTKHFFTAKKIFGKPVTKAGNQDYAQPISQAQQGGATADPTNLWYWHIYYHNYEIPDEMESTTLGVARVKLTYWVKFHKRREMTEILPST